VLHTLPQAPLCSTRTRPRRAPADVLQLTSFTSRTADMASTGARAARHRSINSRSAGDAAGRRAMAAASGAGIGARALP